MDGRAPALPQSGEGVFLVSGRALDASGEGVDMLGMSLTSYAKNVTTEVVATGDGAFIRLHPISARQEGEL